MVARKRFLFCTAGLTLALMGLPACGGPAAAPATATPIPPTATPVPPTATPVPPVTAERSTPPGDVVTSFVDNEGVRIYYEVEGQGPPLVLMHYFTGSTEDWRTFGYVDALKGDYQLILVDMRGHGRSDKPNQREAYAAENLVADVVAVLDELNIDKAHYYGYSLGGKLGWVLAKYAPERFHSFIIGGDGPAASDPPQLIATIRGLGADGWARVMEDTARAYGVWHPGIFPTYAANDFEAQALAAEVLSAEGFETDLSDMQMPILLLAGSQDPEWASVADAASRLPDGTLATLDGLDHGQAFCMIDKALPEVTTFLSGVSGQTSSAAPTIASGFVDNNGVRIHYEIEGQGPPLLLVHWWTGSSRDWTTVPGSR